MTWNALGIEGAWVIKPRVFEDSRGSFREGFRASEFAQVVGHPFHLAQMNISESKAGVLRGIHFAVLPESQAKYVTCVKGSVIDYVIDIRVGSPTFGQWEAVQLDSSVPMSVYLSEGLGHAFMALEDDSTVAYLCSTPFTPSREFGISPFDPELAVQWPTVNAQGLALEPVLSEKDADAPTLAQAAQMGLLPNYQEVVDFRTSLR